MTVPTKPVTPPLLRPRDDRVIAGVASGLARRLGVGTGWVRVGFVFLSFFGGLGLLLYVVGWLAIREEGADVAIAESWIGDLESSSAWVGVGLIVLAGVVLLSATQLVRVELVLAAGLFLVGVLLYRGRLGPIGTDRAATVASPAEVSSDEPASARLSALETSDESAVVDAPASPDEGPVSTTPAPPAPPPPAPPQAPVTVADGAAFVTAPEAVREPRAPSYLGRIVVASGLIVIGGLALFDNLDVVAPAARHYVAAALLVVGLGLIVGSVVGRARGLIVLGLLIVPVLLVTAAVRVPFAGEWGDRLFAPTTVSELQSNYQLSGGQLSIDLRQLDLGDGAEVTPTSADLGIGELIVWLPSDVDVEVWADVGIGELNVFGDENGGIGLGGVFTATGDDGETDLVVTAEVGIGSLRIVRSE